MSHTHTHGGELRQAVFSLTSLGSFLTGAAEGSLGLAMGKENSCSMLEKSGSTAAVQGSLSVAHIELRSEG